MQVCCPIVFEKCVCSVVHSCERCAFPSLLGGGLPANGRPRVAIHFYVSPSNLNVRYLKKLILDVGAPCCTSFREALSFVQERRVPKRGTCRGRAFVVEDSDDEHDEHDDVSSRADTIEQVCSILHSPAH